MRPDVAGAAGDQPGHVAAVPSWVGSGSCGGGRQRTGNAEVGSARVVEPISVKKRLRRRRTTSVSPRKPGASRSASAPEWVAYGCTSSTPCRSSAGRGGAAARARERVGGGLPAGAVLEVQPEAQVPGAAAERPKVDRELGRPGLGVRAAVAGSGRRADPPSRRAGGRCPAPRTRSPRRPARGGDPPVQVVQAQPEPCPTRAWPQFRVDGDGQAVHGAWRRWSSVTWGRSADQIGVPSAARRTAGAAGPGGPRPP